MATYPSSAPNLFALAFPATKKDFRSSRVALRKVQHLSSIQVLSTSELTQKNFKFEPLKSLVKVPNLDKAD